MKKKFIISFFILLIASLIVLVNFNTVQATDSANVQNISITGKREYSKAFEVLDKVNKERQKIGLNKVKMDQTLLDAAMQRAAESAICFSHTRPDGSSFNSISIKALGENSAIGYTSSNLVMDAWMNSEGHKQNILHEQITTIGIGCFYHNGVYYWIQCFGNGLLENDCIKPKDQNKTETISIATEKFNELIGGTKQYSYSFRVAFDNASVEAGKTCNAKVYLINPGYPYAEALIDSDSIKWSSESTKKAKVDSKGKVKGITRGKTNIKAEIGNYKASSEIYIYYGTQKISYKNKFEKSYGDKWFKINAKLERGDGKLSYSSSDKKVATVDSKGKVTIKGTGTCTITVKAKGTSNYKEKKVKITLNVKPKKASLKSVKASKGKKMTIKWSKDTRASGYQIYYSTSKDFSSKNTKKVTVSGNKNTSKTIKSLKKGKKYYVKVRSYKTVKNNGKNQKLYGSWSKVKNITAKK